MTAGRKGFQLARENIGRRRTNRVDAADEGLVAVVSLETLTREVQCDQRRRTRGVDRDRGALEAKIIRQSAAEETAGGAGRDVGVEVEEGIAGFVLIIIVHPADKHAGGFADLFGRPAGSFDRFVADF